MYSLHLNLGLCMMLKASFIRDDNFFSNNLTSLFFKILVSVLVKLPLFASTLSGYCPKRNDLSASPNLISQLITGIGNNGIMFII